jgi:hypothetical protein
MSGLSLLALVELQLIMQLCKPRDLFALARCCKFAFSAASHPFAWKGVRAHLRSAPDDLSDAAQWINMASEGEKPAFCLYANRPPVRIVSTRQVLTSLLRFCVGVELLVNSYVLSAEDIIAVAPLVGNIVEDIEQFGTCYDPVKDSTQQALWDHLLSMDAFLHRIQRLWRFDCLRPLNVAALSRLPHLRTLAIRINHTHHLSSLCASTSLRSLCLRGEVATGSGMIGFNRISELKQFPARKLQMLHLELFRMEGEQSHIEAEMFGYPAFAELTHLHFEYCQVGTKAVNDIDYENDLIASELWGTALCALPKLIHLKLAKVAGINLLLKHLPLMQQSHVVVEIECVVTHPHCKFRSQRPSRELLEKAVSSEARPVIHVSPIGTLQTWTEYTIEVSMRMSHILSAMPLLPGITAIQLEFVNQAAAARQRAVEDGTAEAQRQWNELLELRTIPGVTVTHK